MPGKEVEGSGKKGKKSKKKQSSTPEANNSNIISKENNEEANEDWKIIKKGKANPMKIQKKNK